MQNINIIYQNVNGLHYDKLITTLRMVRENPRIIIFLAETWHLQSVEYLNHPCFIAHAPGTRNQGRLSERADERETGN
jgi:hypothetical protein